MTLTEQGILWSAILIGILLIVVAAGTYWILRTLPAESSQRRVDRAYRAATNRAAEKVPAGHS
jgi:preprotein translocase subunit Sec63